MELGDVVVAMIVGTVLLYLVIYFAVQNAIRAAREDERVEH